MDKLHFNLQRNLFFLRFSSCSSFYVCIVLYCYNKQPSLLNEQTKLFFQNGINVYDEKKSRNTHNCYCY